MKIISKSILCFFIAVLLFSSAGGYFVLYVLQQANYTYVRMEDNSKSNLDVFKLSVESYKSNRQYEKEFVHNGKWYDVVATKVKGDFVFIYCKHDKFEECVLGVLDDLFKNGKHQSQSQQMVKLFFALSAYEPREYIFYIHENDFDVFPLNETPLTSCFVEIVSPPPKA